MIDTIKHKKVFLETYGCQMNEYDSELIRSILTKANFAFVNDESDADVIMLNTCAIRENAYRKIYGRIHEIHHKFNGSSPLIGILGCMATNLRKDLLESRNLKIDFIAGPDSYKRLPQLIQNAFETGEKQYDVTLSEFETYSDIFPRQGTDGDPSARPELSRRPSPQGDFSHSRKVNAWIAVMRGCNNFCTFCVVPYTRGRERSRSPQNIIEEVRRLADDGFRQVTLLGQNVNSYHHEGNDFADLIERVSEVCGIERIRFTSPHPKDFPDRLLSVIAVNKKACKHVHLPLQAGNNRILELMDRSYTREEYLALVEKIRTLIPGVALTTDIIAGFATETDAEFEDTLSLMKDVEYDSAFIFKYSERQGTIAQKKYPDDISEEKKTERVMRVNELQRAITLKKNQAHINETLDILIEEERTPRSIDDFQGRTDGNKLVIIRKGAYRKGEFVKVRITDATATVLKGDVVSQRGFSRI